MAGKPQSDTPSVEDEKSIGAVQEVNITELAVEDNLTYNEYLVLQETFQGDKLKKLTRKVDFHLLPTIFFYVLWSYIDRGNVGNAKLFGAIADMGMTASDWNVGLSIFFLAYAVGGPPASYLLRRFGPKRVLPGTMICVSLSLIGGGLCNNRVQWFSLRMLLGILEAGMYPSSVFTISTYYSPNELHSRATLFYLGAATSGGFSGILAYAIGQADGVWGYRGWRWIYVVEGLVSLTVAIIGIFTMVDKPEKGAKWLTEEERQFLVLRNRFAYGGDKSGNSNELRVKDYLNALKSWHVWIFGWMFINTSILNYGFAFALPTIISNLGFSAANAQLLSVPPYVFAGFCIVINGYISDRCRQRMLVLVVPASIALVGLIMCMCSVTHKSLTGLALTGALLVCGGGYCLTSCIAVWAALNQAGQTKRSAALAIAVFLSNIGGVAGSNIYLTREAPGYKTGFGFTIAFTTAGLIVTPIVYWWVLGRINQRRAAIPEEEIYAKYTPQQLTDMGDLSPLYRYER